MRKNGKTNIVFYCCPYFCFPLYSLFSLSLIWYHIYTYNKNNLNIQQFNYFDILFLARIQFFCGGWIRIGVSTQIRIRGSSRLESITIVSVDKWTANPLQMPLLYIMKSVFAKGRRKKSYFYSGPATKGEGVKAWPLRKNDFFWRSKKKFRKNVAMLSSEEGALVAQPLK